MTKRVVAVSGNYRDYGKIPGTMESAFTAPNGLANDPSRARARGSQFVITAALAWVVLVSGVAYVLEKRRLLTAHATDSTVVEASGAPAISQEKAVPVLFANPFDASEVFEFPPGTREADARDAVARILLERARDRLSGTDRLQRTASVMSTSESR